MSGRENRIEVPKKSQVGGLYCRLPSSKKTITVFLRTHGKRQNGFVILNGFCHHMPAHPMYKMLKEAHAFIV